MEAQKSGDRDIIGELERECANVMEAATTLRDTLLNYKDPSGLRNRLKQFEHHGDEIVHGVFETLNSTFITPIDREDIIALASSLDSILDMVYASALRMDLYKIRQSTRPMLELTDIVCSSLKELQAALRLIKTPDSVGDVDGRAVEVNRLENLADDLMNRAIADLFETNDPVQIMKLKEIYEKLEEATDYCEDVADILSGIVAKNR